MKVYSGAAGFEASKHVEKQEAATRKSVDEQAANKFDPIIYFNYSGLYTKDRVCENSADHKSPANIGEGQGHYSPGRCKEEHTRACRSVMTN